MYHRRNSKDRKMLTATFKHIALPNHQNNQNEEEKQFAQTLAKQSTIDKVNALQFQNDTQKCRSLVDFLLKEYDLLHPQTQSTICDQNNYTNEQITISDQSKENYFDGIKENDEDNRNQTENSNIKLKSNIIFLELENKKLELKQKLLEKKCQKQVLQIKMAPSMEIMLRKREKQLLEIQLDLLKQVKKLSQKLQHFKKPSPIFLQNSIHTNKQYLNIQNTSKAQPTKRKKINKLKLLKFLLQKAETINSQQQFIRLLNKTSESMVY